MAKTLYGILAREDEEEAEYGPRITTGTDWYSIWRVISWAAIVTIILACAVGFVALASFVVDQVAWITFIVTAGYLIYALATEAVDRAIQPGSVAGRAAMNTVGLARGSLRQIATLLQGVLALVLSIVCTMLILAPWGVESDDMFGTLRAAFFGFKVGDITISLSGILLAIGLFIGGVVFTRVLQSWLEDRFLPTTRLDLGLRNSIRASVGYVGVFIAAAMALGYMGLSFDKLAIVAGALSVGYRLRSSGHRRKLRLRPHPAVGARHPRGRSDRGGQRHGTRSPHQRALDRDRNQRPRDRDRAEFESYHGRGEELGAQRPHEPRARAHRRHAERIA